MAEKDDALLIVGVAVAALAAAAIIAGLLAQSKQGAGPTAEDLRMRISR